MTRSAILGVAVLLSQPEASATALRELRSLLSANAGAPSIQGLAQQLSSEVPFPVGVYPASRAQEVAQRLEDAGFRVLLTKHDAG